MNRKKGRIKYDREEKRDNKKEQKEKDDEEEKKVLADTLGLGIGET
jgi:hypothetical protein